MCVAHKIHMKFKPTWEKEESENGCQIRRVYNSICISVAIGTIIFVADDLLEGRNISFNGLIR